MVPVTPGSAADAAHLPPPDADAAAHSERLVDHIRADMRDRDGALPFSRFMELALYAPGLGYYAAGARKFGADGDFVTAPEVSELFGRCLAHQCLQVFDQSQAQILELGAGSGALAVTVLRELRAQDRLPDRYWILEPSADLRRRQQQLLEQDDELARRVSWLDTLPDAFSGVVLANEVLDALPVERFRVTDGGFEQACVIWGDDGFQWSWRMAPTPLHDALTALQQDLAEPMPSGYVSELCLWTAPWLRSLGDALQTGLALLIDYGYPRREHYHPQRHQGTLQCHYRHRVHDDPLSLVGLQDITAFVDFTAVAEAADAAGLEVAGFTSQAQFLIGAGLMDLVAESDPGDMRAHLELMRQVKMLTLPGEMGERFKVMGLARNLDAPLAGFSGVDLRGRL